MKNVPPILPALFLLAGCSLSFDEPAASTTCVPGASAVTASGPTPTYMSAGRGQAPIQVPPTTGTPTESSGPKLVHQGTGQRVRVEEGGAAPTDRTEPAPTPHLAAGGRGVAPRVVCQ